jgi:hypothetical protein
MRLLSKLLRCVALTIVACGTFPGVTLSKQPPDVVVSDAQLNTAMGTDALKKLTTSSSVGGNTAAGGQALSQNTTGSDNTAVGDRALSNNTTGEVNTAIGDAALLLNQTGYSNVAVGGSALQSQFTGTFNTAVGEDALYSEDGASNNTAVGAGALTFTVSGSDNTAVGVGALTYNVTGLGNTAIGYESLLKTTGKGNIGVGPEAGLDVTGGSHNIEIGNVGLSTDSGAIRIGTQGSQTATYIAGISGHHLTGAAVYVTSSGELGILASSERYKTGIEPMAQRTEKLQQLRPVTFHLKTDPRGDVQYGLIAEEVAKVYPELVIRDKTGRVEGVHYEELAPMLLNEVQKQSEEIRAMQAQIAELKRSTQGRSTEK